MKYTQKELDDIMVSFTLKTEHEQAKDLKNLKASESQLKKDLGSVEAEIQSLMIAGFKVKDDPVAVAPYEQQVATKEAQERAIRSDIEQTAALLSRLTDMHVETQVIKLLRRARKLSVKAVEQMLKKSTSE